MGEGSDIEFLSSDASMEFEDDDSDNLPDPNFLLNYLGELSW